MIRFFFQAEDGIRDLVRSRGLGDVYKRQLQGHEGRDGEAERGGVDVGAPAGDHATGGHLVQARPDGDNCGRRPAAPCRPRCL